MNKYKIFGVGTFLILWFLLITNFTYSQLPFHISAKNSSLIATDSVQPFWFTANQHGKVPANSQFLNITDIQLNKDYSEKVYSGFSYICGTELVAALGNENSFQLNRAYAGIAFKGWELKGGLYYDTLRYAGLSTSNGILAQTGNSRPVPGFRFSTYGYKKLPFAKKWFSFRGEYEEGLLNDKRYVEGAHLHHKSLYGLFKLNGTTDFTLGFEHYVMWGGTSPNPNIGRLPGWEDYWRYVFALPGNEDFPQTDQLNSSGNQLGTFQFELAKRFKPFNLSVYLSHPWEDNSGLNWHNWIDNLIGFYVKIKKERPFVTDVLYEFTNTRQQSIRNSSDKEYDNYYNHGVYASGFTYRQQVMNSPLFFPVQISNGIAMGTRSNRLISHHLGMQGYLSDYLLWKGMFTWIEHLGTYSQPYDPKHKQLSGLIDLAYKNPSFPVDLGVAIAADATNTSGNNLGFQFTISKTW